MICIIDPTELSRNTLAVQLRTIESKLDVSQNKVISDFKKSLLYLKKLNTINFAFLSKDCGPLEDLLELILHLREANSHCAIILTATSLSHDEAKVFIRSGVSQILMSPYTEAQLTQKMQSASNFAKQVDNEAKAIPKDSVFKSWTEEFTPEVMSIKLSGWITESSELPAIATPNEVGITLFIDCEEIKGINSIGIRSWLLWLKDLEKNGVVRFELQNVRENILRQASMVQGFLPASGNVNSFFLTYENDDLEIEKEFKFQIDPKNKKKSLSLPKTIGIHYLGSDMIFEIPISYKKLLAFYKDEIVLTELEKRDQL